MGEGKKLVSDDSVLHLQSLLRDKPDFGSEMFNLIRFLCNGICLLLLIRILIFMFGMRKTLLAESIVKLTDPFVLHIDKLIGTVRVDQSFFDFPSFMVMYFVLGVWFVVKLATQMRQLRS